MLRKLDDPVRLGGVLSVRSAGLLASFASLVLGLELKVELFSRFVGPLVAPVVVIGVIAVAGAVLVAAERHEDEHYVPSAIRYYGSLRWRGVWSAGVVAPWRRPALTALAAWKEEWSWL